ncbi:MAG: CRISPR-associated helicase Cas3' [Oscillospiraceae bacterium]|nr:CRISPR-associated helicase Cas3' [Oscillospiraceae bacterium]
MNEYFAHFRMGLNGNRETQTVAAHCRQTAEYASNTLKPIDLDCVGFLAGLLHDVGKRKPEFQAYLNRADGVRGTVDHSSCGMQMLFQRFHGAYAKNDQDVACEIMAYAVAAHHGQMDIVNARSENGFLRRLKAETAEDRQAKNNFLAQCTSEAELSAYFQRASNQLSPVLERLCEITAKEDEVYFYTGLLARLILSAVIEGDRRDTAEFMNARDAFDDLQVDRCLWEECLVRVEKRLAGFPMSEPIHLARKKISEQCRARADLPCGIYRLNVPTGGGKTLACLRFALAHAAIHGKKRILFTAPLLSILDQNAQVIRTFVQDDALILEHHSNVVQETAEDPEQNMQNELWTENWSAPIIITTLVQLLNTFFSGKSSCTRRFQSLCDSIIVIDEVQTVPTKLLSLFQLAINFLSEVCHATILLCSATQPCSEYTEHPLQEGIKDLVLYDENIWNAFRRTTILDAGRKRLEDVAAFTAHVLSKRESLLVVCNTKVQASFLYQQLQQGDARLFYLSAGMCMAHRRVELERLKAALEQRRAKPDASPKVVCVSTQVIEAGVDISFDGVIRFAAGMDSIVQAAGRCNRNGERQQGAPVYVVCCEDERLANLTEIRDAKHATLALLSQFEAEPAAFGDDLSSESAIRFFYRNLYRNMAVHACDGPVKGKAYTLYQLLSDNAYFASGCSENQDAMQFYLRQAFQTAGQAFQVFDEDTTDVLVPYGQGAELAKELGSGWAKYDLAAVKELLDQAKPYTVSLYRGQLNRLEREGALYPLANGSILTLDPRYYDKNGVGVLSEALEMELWCM